MLITHGAARRRHQEKVIWHSVGRNVTPERRKSVAERTRRSIARPRDEESQLRYDRRWLRARSDRFGAEPYTQRPRDCAQRRYLVRLRRAFHSQSEVLKVPSNRSPPNCPLKC